MKVTTRVKLRDWSADPVISLGSRELELAVDRARPEAGGEGDQANGDPTIAGGEHGVVEAVLPLATLLGSAADVVEQGVGVLVHDSTVTDPPGAIFTLSISRCRSN